VATQLKSKFWYTRRYTSWLAFSFGRWCFYEYPNQVYKASMGESVSHPTRVLTRTLGKAVATLRIDTKGGLEAVSLFYILNSIAIRSLVSM
jgi:hypothetical protein